MDCIVFVVYICKTKANNMNNLYDLKDLVAELNLIKVSGEKAKTIDAEAIDKLVRALQEAHDDFILDTLISK